MHGGDIDESLRPYSYWTKTGHEAQDHVSRASGVVGWPTGSRRP
jgi:hypothetical protein